MNNLIEIGNNWKSKADKLIEEKGLINFLSKYGEVKFTGAYSYNLMMHGDVDISVIRDLEYSAEEVFTIFKDLYFSGKFRSYFIGGDWDDNRKGNIFPNGRYFGLKEKIDGEKWKFDIWFMTKSEYIKRENTSLINLSDEQRILILEIKEYRNKNYFQVTGQEIYDNVLSGKWKNVADIQK